MSEAPIKEAISGNLSDEQLLNTANQALLEILEYLKGARSVVGDLGDLATTQTPLLAQEVLDYAIFDSTFDIALGVACIIWGVWAIRWSFHKAEERIERYKQHDAALRSSSSENFHAIWADDFIMRIFHHGVPIGGVIVGFVGGFGLLNGLFDLYKPIFDPRLYLLEYFRALVN